MRVLIPMFGSLGHFHPFVPLARALEAAGNDVAFACPTESFGHVVRDNGFRHFHAGFEWLYPDGGSWIDESMGALERRYQAEGRAFRGEDQGRWMAQHFFAGRMAESMIPDLLDLYQTWPFDLVLRDDVEFAGYIVAERLGIPHVMTGYANFSSPEHLRRVFGRSVARLREDNGLPPDPSMTGRWRYLDLKMAPRRWPTSEDYVSPVSHFIRPISFDRSGPEELPVWLNDLSSQPTVYGTLGTVASTFPGACDVFTAIVDAFRSVPVDLS